MNDIPSRQNINGRPHYQTTVTVVRSKSVQLRRCRIENELATKQGEVDADQGDESSNRKSDQRIWLDE